MLLLNSGSFDRLPSMFQKINALKDKDVWKDFLNDGRIPFCSMQHLRFLLSMTEVYSLKGL
jgi:hypothetical protein